MKYLAHYPANIRQQAEQLLHTQQTTDWFLQKYPNAHTHRSDRALYEFTQTLKERYLRSSAPISSVRYDDHIHAVDHALGMHRFVSRVQGKKLKAKNEIRISRLFRQVPEAFLTMIVVHELAHLREKEHNKAFYKLCCYMEPAYHQLEFECRLYLCHLEQFGAIWQA